MIIVMMMMIITPIDSRKTTHLHPCLCDAGALLMCMENVVLVGEIAWGAYPQHFGEKAR
jgi:hypothetical protein